MRPTVLMRDYNTKQHRYCQAQVELSLLAAGLHILGWTKAGWIELRLKNLGLSLHHEPALPSVLPPLLQLSTGFVPQNSSNTTESKPWS